MKICVIKFLQKNLKQVLHLAKALVMKLPVVAVVKVVIEDLVTVIVQKEKNNLLIKSKKKEVRICLSSN